MGNKLNLNFILLFVIFYLFSSSFQSPSSCSNQSNSSSSHSSISLASFDLNHVSPMLPIGFFVLIAALIKIAFHYIPYLPQFIPESCVLIVIGTLVGLLLSEVIKVGDDFRMSPNTFLLFLLPPIILEASYTLNDKSFGYNVGTILVYAVLGTLINFIIIGLSLWGLSFSSLLHSLSIPGIQYLLFSSFIVAVDPVAVLAIFQDIGVNQVLYFLVFGESLLNDAVTIVLYRVIEAFSFASSVEASQIVIGILSFFTVSLGGLFIGILFGIATCFITRVTVHVRVTEPLTILLMAYLSYLCAEIFHWSGIISMIGCGLIEAHYAFKNISKKSYITVLYFIKMLSSSCETIVFFFLGLELIRTDHEWDTAFILFSLVFCLVSRLISVFGLTAMVKLVCPRKQISFADQFIMWYGGLRGAVCFALCNSLTVEPKTKNLFLTTTFIIIIFTVFVQGITIKPLVKYCGIKRSDNEQKLLIEFQNLMHNEISKCIESILEQKSQFKFLDSLDSNRVRKVLVRNNLSTQQQFLEIYKEVALKRYKSMLGKNVKPDTSSNYVKRPSVTKNLTDMNIEKGECDFEGVLVDDVENEMIENDFETYFDSGRSTPTLSKIEIIQVFRTQSQRDIGAIVDKDMAIHDIKEDRDETEELRRNLNDLQDFVKGRPRNVSYSNVTFAPPYSSEKKLIKSMLDVKSLNNRHFKPRIRRNTYLTTVPENKEVPKTSQRKGMVNSGYLNDLKEEKEENNYNFIKENHVTHL